MKIVEASLKGVHVLHYNSFKDNRGEFIKTIHQETFEEHHLHWQFTESFYSVSGKNVLRGMHFQYAPADHHKLIYVVTGRILDVVLDLRSESETFGKFFSIELSKQNRLGLFIEKGFAHGFLALEEDTVVEYHTSKSQVKESEGGVNWKSFGFNWPVERPILSIRDSEFLDFDINKKYF